MGDDLTVEILKQIRDGIGQTNTRVDLMREDFHSLREELCSLRNDFNLRIERVEHGLNDLGGFMKGIALDQARHERFHAEHVTHLERDVRSLEERVQRLETRTET